MTVAEYLERVRTALADLPPNVRNDLLDDLREHLTEVAAESDEPLEARVGSPEAYAAELRATVEPTPAGPVPLGVRLATAVRRVQEALRPTDTRIGRLLGYDTAGAFLRQLRPGWWVLRGYLAAMVIAYLINGGSRTGLVPRLDGTYGIVAFVCSVALLAVCLVTSVWLGRRADSLAVLPRLLVVAASLFVFVGGAIGFADADSVQLDDATYSGNGYQSQYPNVEDVYVYDRDGNLVTDATLVDQDGRPIYIGDTACPHPSAYDWPTYPRCQRTEPAFPGARPSMTPTPEPTWSSQPSSAPTVVSPGSPTVAPTSPTATPAPSAATPAATSGAGG